MILEKLYQYYDVLEADPKSGVAPIGYSSAKVDFEIILSKEGELAGITDLRQEDGKKMLRPVEVLVPLQRKRTAGITPYFLCDKSKYVFGLDKKKDGKGDEKEICQKHFDAFKEENEKYLKGMDDPEVKAYLKFLSRWRPEATAENEIITPRLDEVVNASNFVFRVEGFLTFLHENLRVKKRWQECFEEVKSDYEAQCLITGKVAPIAQVHQSIKGVAGAQSTGAAIVSFNIPSFRSYGKEQSFNAPISENAMLKYTTALNYLLSGENRIKLGDTTVVFWAEKKAEQEESFFKAFLDPPFKEEGRNTEESELPAVSPKEMEDRVKDVLSAVREGRSVDDAIEHPDVLFHILGLAPNVSRLSIRLWMVNRFGTLVERLAKHHLDMEVVKPPNVYRMIPVWALLKEMAVLGKTENIPNNMITALNYAIFNGTAYPFGMYASIIKRIRADHDVNYVRAGFIKAYLNRSNTKKEECTVALDLQNKEPAYLLGRLFSLLEKAQQEASGGGLNATIKDRYFGAASATPAVIFPQLLKLSQNHMAKAKYGRAMDRRIGEIFDLFSSTGFPKRLDLEEQGKFILGYYHQKRANYPPDEAQE